MGTKKNSLTLLFVAAVFASSAQDTSLLHLLNDSMAANPKKTYVTGTFKAEHIVNLQTIESPAHGNLNFVIQHRFGTLNSGSYNFYGLDNATLRLGLDYGITDDLAVGVGRSSYLKTFDGYLKYKLLRQTDGPRIPVSISLLGTVTDFTQDITDEVFLSTQDRVAYSAELLIARKFGRNLSLQISPAYLYYNFVPTPDDKNGILAVGLGGRMKISKRMSIEAEYDVVPKNQIVSYQVHNSFSLGWDIETGGHVFQLVFTNSQSMVPTQFLTETTGTWGKGDIYFGFNISRNFNLNRKRR